MKTIIKKIGNEIGVIIPDSILKKLDLKVGNKVDIDVINGQIVVSKSKLKYTLDELLVKCDPNAPLTEEIKEWDQIKPVGLECLSATAVNNE
jgi:antitoxin ChpS